MNICNLSVDAEKLLGMIISLAIKSSKSFLKWRKDVGKEKTRQSIKDLNNLYTMVREIFNDYGLCTHDYTNDINYHNK